MNTNRRPVAYLRRSASIDPTREQSREAQEASVRRLARDEGLDLFVDWGISGGRNDRPQYQRLRAEVAADRVSVVYAYSLSRLGRSTTELLAFFDLCRVHGTAVETEADGRLGADTAMGNLLLTIMAAVATFEREVSAERSAAARKVREARGDRFGQAPVGHRHVRQDGCIVRVADPDKAAYMESVRAAYVEAGTILGAVRLLNERGIPSPKGGRWYQSPLTKVILREWPELLPARSVAGKRIKATATFAQLIQCHCGTVMTPNVKRGQYYCSRGHVQADHGRYSVAEVMIRPALVAEAARLRLPGNEVEMAATTAAQREAITARVERFAEMYGEGAITRARYDAEKARARSEIDRLDAAQTVVELPEAVDWEMAPERLNAVLRGLWRAVRLDENLRVAAVEWNVPDWRSDAAVAA